MNDIVVKFFSGRILLTLDTNQLFKCLFERFGECQITFVSMTIEEKVSASANVDGIEAVRERFWVFLRSDGGFVRQREIEDDIVRLGQK